MEDLFLEPVVLYCGVPGCEQSFQGKYRKGNLNRHMRHKHRAPLSVYPCAEPHCGKTFARSDARLKHHRRHHPWLMSEPRPASSTTPVGHGQDARDLESPLDYTSPRLGASGNDNRSVLDNWLNLDPINTGSWGPTHRRYSESFERPPSIVSEDAITLDEVHPQTDSHIADPVESINNEWENQSVRSIESSTTLVSILSGYTAVEMESATIELRRVLQEDLQLARLYRFAIGDASIGPERLQRNLGRLLKQMAQDLKVEAKKELERLTSRFVAVKARNIAHCIVLDLQVTRRPQQDIERPEESESEQEDNTIDENRFEDLTVFRTFVVESGAFQIFRSRLEAFVHPKSLPRFEAKIEVEGIDANNWTSKSRLSLGWLGSICMSTISITGFVESQIPSHAVRLKWLCVSHLNIAVQT